MPSRSQYHPVRLVGIKQPILWPSTPQQIVCVHYTTPGSARSYQCLALPLPMLCERHRTTDSHPVRSAAIFERRQVQNDCLPFAKVNALNVAPGRTRAVSLCTLTANKHLVGITIQQLKGSTRRSIRRFYVHRNRDFTPPGGKGIKIFNLLALQLALNLIGRKRCRMVPVSRLSKCGTSRGDKHQQTGSQ